mmetsp:Transcript_931/g.1701  ORF Transcript_931/g.1701 Transcript_931/m.1701 type:complete len:82 (+) Transcript_931:272-517(+)
MLEDVDDNDDDDEKRTTKPKPQICMNEKNNSYQTPYGNNNKLEKEGAVVESRRRKGRQSISKLQQNISRIEEPQHIVSTIT